MASPIHIAIDPRNRTPLLRDQNSTSDAPSEVPVKHVHTHPRHNSTTNTSTSSSSKPPPQSNRNVDDGSIYFIGTATTILEWHGLRILTDPNFLHAGDHVHLGPGVTAQRKTNPAVDLHELPPLDLVLLSHYHEDHFDRLVEKSLRRDVRIVTTPHAKKCLVDDKRKEVVEMGEGPFEEVTALDFWESAVLHVVDGGDDKGAAAAAANTGESEKELKKNARVKITGMPGKHVPPGPLSVANDLLNAVPPTNGWLLELGYEEDDNDEESKQTAGYRIYISGDTLFVDELKEIPKRLKDNKLDLMLVHLGGTTIPGPSMPLLMVTMDADQGFKLMQLMDPDVTIPIHFDDYDVFLSPLQDFKDKVNKEGWEKRVVYLDRGEMYRFRVAE